MVAATASLLSGVARPDGDPSVAADGADLFRTKGCAVCHSGPDHASMTGAGPSLANVSAWAADRVPDLSAEEYVELSIRNPSAFISPVYTPSGGPGEGMPLLRLSDGEIDAIVRYLLEPPLVSSDGTE